MLYDKNDVLDYSHLYIFGNSFMGLILGVYRPR